MRAYPFFLHVGAFFVLSAQVGATEDEVAAYGTILDQCYASATTEGALRDCVGEMSSACMDEQDGGHTTLGMTACLNAEAQAWDKYLNSEYRSTIEGLATMDRDEATVFPEFAEREETLRNAQRAWITFRDAECGLAYALWGSGSMRNIAYASCQLDMTAERVLELRVLGSDMR